MSKDESFVQQEIQIHAKNFDCNLMRNNSGALKDDTGRLIRFGLGNVSKSHSDKVKSSDLIGFTKVVITPEMVGKTVAIFTAIEVKKESWKSDPNDKRETAQNNFIKWIVNNGGYAGFCNCIDNLKTILRK
jgi:hypothetical protein